MKRLNCKLCKFYYVTWNSQTPHGCKAYGFKSGHIPSIIVFRDSGVECQFYEERELKK